MSYRTLHTSALFSSILFLATTLGCGDSGLGTVSGTVHMDGQPLSDAVITFYPIVEDASQGGGGASYGRTNENGEYELQYNRSTKGAEIGQHKVEITTLVEGGGGDYGPGKKETVPNKYNIDTELMVEVISGHNVIDFLDLDSSGPVTQGRGY